MKRLKYFFPNIFNFLLYFFKLIKVYDITTINQKQNGHPGYIISTVSFSENRTDQDLPDKSVLEGNIPENLGAA